MSLDPHFWGPSVWKALHTFAAGYNPEKRQQFVAFIWSLSQKNGLLPCEECRHHFTKMISEPELKLEFYLEDRDKLFLWTWLLHDKVNQRLGKSGLTLAQAKEIYFNPHVFKSDGQDFVSRRENFISYVKPRR